MNNPDITPELIEQYFDDIEQNRLYPITVIMKDGSELKGNYAGRDSRNLCSDFGSYDRGWIMFQPNAWKFVYTDHPVRIELRDCSSMIYRKRENETSVGIDLLVLARAHGWDAK